jgi:predicted FMN-binding regulatory protein PaiB
MYVPNSFSVTDRDRLHGFIEQYSFGLLVTQQAGQSVASHLPLLLDRAIRPHGRLIGHMSREPAMGTRGRPTCARHLLRATRLHLADVV